MLIGLTYIFVLCAFSGWIAESTFRTIVERKPTNAGFLFGPFIPIYGFGGLIIYALYIMRHNIPFPVVLTITVLLITGLEFAVSWIFEKIIGKRLWDYSHLPFNIHGRVCLLFSFFWLILVIFTWFILFPLILNIKSHLSPVALSAVTFLCIGYMLSDFVYSTSMARVILNIIKPLSEPLPKLQVLKNRLLMGISDRIKSFRFIKLFLGPPMWLRNMITQAQDFIKAAAPMQKIIAVKNSIRVKHQLFTTGISVREFITISADIISHINVRRLRETIHHHRYTRYYHVLHVAFEVYRWCKILNLDYYEATRAAILHDFFYFDWRENKMKGYPWMHPLSALKNARRYFSLSKKQEEIIEMHMWPLYLGFPALPKYAETWTIIIVDKLQTLREYSVLPLEFIRVRLFQKKIHFVTKSNVSPISDGLNK